MQDILLFLENHWILSLTVLVILFLLMMVELIRLKHAPKRITPQQAIQLINHQNAVMVDIRPVDAYATGHIVGAVSLPLSELETKYKKLDKFKTQPIVLICASGLESPRAVKILMKYQINPLTLAGGIRGWRDAELPLVKD